MKLIRSIGRCRLNNFGASIYETKKGASIVFDKLGHDLPRKNNIVFDSVEEAEEWVEARQGSNGVSTLRNVLRELNND
jgi:hypothetical protein